MHLNRREVEFRMFGEARTELRDALRTNDLATARLAIEELEAISMHSKWPALRTHIEAELGKTFVRTCVRSTHKGAL